MVVRTVEIVLETWDTLDEITESWEDAPIETEELGCTPVETLVSEDGVLAVPVVEVATGILLLLTTAVLLKESPNPVEESSGHQVS